MDFPLSISDIGLWIAIMAIILLTTSELLSSSSIYSRSIAIDKKKFRLVALTLGMGFIVIVVIHIIQNI